MDVSTITDIIVQPGIRTVSFDIFDTLLERPALHPSDIFFLLNDPVKDLLQRDRFDFHRIRKNIEHEAVQHHAGGDRPEYTLSFDQIYDYFRIKHQLTNEQTQQIMELERDLERSLLAPRAIGRQLFEAARKAGKRIVCISDMYFDQPYLSELLARNGFTGIDAIYVSSEIKKRKDSGALFTHALTAERLAAHELIHIGDHIDSDYRIPLALGIPACHILSSTEHFFSRSRVCNNVWTANYAPTERLVIGFYLNRWSEQQAEGASYFPQKSDIGYFGIGPILFGIAQYLRTSRAIQDHYPRIHFASRDGYLPMKAYDFLNEDSARQCIPSNYLYCGRALYHVAGYQGSPLQHLTQRLQKMWCGPDMTIGHLFDSLVCPAFLSADGPRRDRLVSAEINERFPVLQTILNERHTEVDRLLREKQNRLRAYYAESLSFSRQRRALVFDCGCGGSVSTNIMKVVRGRIDKAYLCETARNRLTDRIHRTRTHLLLGDLHDLQPMGSLSIFEEIFSPMDGPCFDLTREPEGWVPVSDPGQAPSAATAEDVLALQSAAMDFVRDIKDRFGSLLDRLVINHVAFTGEPLLAALRAPTDMSIRHFENIVFPDAFYGDSRPLSEKIEDDGRDHLLRTPFVDRAMTISGPALQAQAAPCRVGLHLHLYHVDMAPSFLDRLARWHAPYDLFISVCSPHDARTAHVLFSPLLEQNVGKLDIRVFPNRGRDTGAWVAGFGPDLAAYDLAGHVHAKRSPHFAWGDQWREYLLDNVIGWDAFEDIRAHFQGDPSLGLVFPPAYDGVFEFWGNNRLTHLEEIDRRNSQDLLRRMGVNTVITKHSLHFSVGTMFWYRPAALAPLIDLGLSFDNFEPEPIGITGSLAHAIERLPALVAAHSGFSTRAYIRPDELLDRFHRQRLRSIGVDRSASGFATFQTKAISSLCQVLLPLLPRGTRRYRLAQAAAKTINAFVHRS